jgi:hypothetical protein
MKSLADRVWSKVDKSAGEGACWPWTGHLSRGKPTLSLKPTTVSARKVVWELVHGERPPMGMHVEVTCGNVICLNQAHLICPTTEERFWQHVEKTEGCWNWTGAFAKGFTRKTHHYGAFCYRENGKRVWIMAHRFSWELHNGPIEGHEPGHPEKEICVLHTCDNPKCVRPDHLFLGTDADNIADCIAKGRNSRGSEHGEKVRRAREARNNMKRLAESVMAGLNESDGGGG